MAAKNSSMKQMYGRKVGMTRIFAKDGESIPVTVIEVQPNVITQVKTVENEGYQALQIGLGEQKQHRLSRALVGHFAKAQKGLFKKSVELRLDNPGQRATAFKAADYKPGDEVTVGDTFVTGDVVDVIGVSMGKGFAGVMKRHHMKGFPMTRGTHEYRRHGGSIGNRKFPGRVFKNKRMPGHMGNERVTQENLEVVAVRPDDNLLLIRGSVPGAKNEFVLVRTAAKSIQSISR